MRTNTAWLTENIDDLINFCRLNSLPKVALTLETSKEMYLNEEAEIELRKRQPREVVLDI
ncbi:hypothetical protein C8N43_2084 [Litoreibacter ponti]|uniref:Uncharacterized protein n=1 Tax=Litoreibacter ponti TaxID=1510457 RepID=A0A2T6BN46_9RHOB|nr:hypothetical protein [Litoreibacter ponti]PTX57417.1 hypothetical protein C8N43_2084 [Litoreibacter ponti]